MALPNSFGGSRSSSGGGGGAGVLDVFNPSTPDRTSQRTSVAGSALTTREQLQGVARLIHSGNPQGEAYASNFIRANAHRFSEEELREYGLDEYVPSDGRNWLQKAAGTAMDVAGKVPGANAAMGAFGKVTGVLSRPQQVAAKFLKQTGENAAYGIYAATHNGIGISGDEARIIASDAKQGYGDAAAAATDISGSRDINSREMLNLDKNLGGSGWFGDYVVGALDLGGQMATDPLSYTGGFAGAREATETGLRAVEKRLGPEVAEGIRNGTIKGLTEEQSAKVLEELRAQATEAGAGQRGRVAGRILGKGEKVGGPFERLNQNALADQAGRSGALKGATGAERVAQRNLNAVINRGQEGLKYFGKTVVPRSAMRTPFERAGLVARVESYANPEIQAIAKEHAAIEEKLAKLDVKEASVRSTPAFETTADTRLPEIDAERTALEQQRHALEEKLYAADAEVQRTKTVPNKEKKQAEQEIKQRERSLAALDKSAQRTQVDVEQATRLRDEAVERLHALQAQRENVLRAEVDLNGRVTANNPRLQRVLDQIEDAQKKAQKAEDALGKKLLKAQNIDAQKGAVSGVLKEAEDVNAYSLPTRKVTETVPNPEFDPKAKITEQLPNPERAELEAKIADTEDRLARTEAKIARLGSAPDRYHRELDAAFSEKKVAQAELEALEAYLADMRAYAPRVEETNPAFEEFRADTFLGDDAKPIEGRRVEGAFWHGTSNTIKKLMGREGVDPVGNLYGPGFYTTEDLGIAGQYSVGKGGGKVPTRYNVKWTGEGKPEFFNLDTTEPGAIPPGPMAKMRDEIQSMYDSLDTENDLYPDELDRMNNLTTELELWDDPQFENRPFRELYQDYKATLKSAYGYDSQETKDALHDLTTAFEDEGFAGFSHEGGHIMGGGVAHKVQIVFDPTKLEIKEVPVDKVRRTDLPDDYYPMKGEANKASAKFQAANERTNKASDEVRRTDTREMGRYIEDLKDEVEEAKTYAQRRDAAVKKSNDMIDRMHALEEQSREQRVLYNNLQKYGTSAESKAAAQAFADTAEELEQLKDEFRALQDETDRFVYGTAPSKAQIAEMEAELASSRIQQQRNLSRDKKNIRRGFHRKEQLEEQGRALRALKDETPETIPGETRKSTAGQIEDIQKQVKRLDREEERLLQNAVDTDAKWDARVQKRLDKIEAKREELNGRADELVMREREIPDTLEQRRVRGPLDIIGRRVERASEGISRNFVTGADVKRNPNLGPQLDKYIKSLRTTSQGKANAKVDDAIRILRNAAIKARDEDKLFDKELAEVVYPKMETPGGRAELVETFRAEGRNAAADYVETLDAIGRRTGERVIEGGLPPEFLHDPETYLERIFTPEGKKAARRQLAKGTNVPGYAPNQLAQDFAQGGALKPRGWRPDAPVSELQDEAKELLDTRGPVFQQNPTAAVAHRAAAVEKSIAQQEFLDGLKKWKGKDGLPVLIDDADEANRRGFQAIPTPQGTVYADAAVAKEIQRFQDVVLNDEALKSFQRFTQRMTKYWKAYATVPLIGAAFHARNAETNMMLNWMAGMGLNSARFYGESARAMRAITKAEKLMSKDVSFEEAIAKATKGDTELAKHIQWAREDEVLSSSYFHSDLADEGPRLGSRTKKRRAVDLVDPRSMHNAAIGPGRFVGSTVEDNARLAHYLWALDKYGSRETAARSVKKYLFDYEDLTAFEKNHLRGPIMPFYTFMRKNTALMARMMAENPGKLSRITRLEQQTLNENDEGLRDQALPEYITRDQHQGPRSFLPSGIVGSIESPLSAAVETAETPGKFLSGDVSGGARATLNQGGGPVPEALKILVEQTTNQDLYTGGYVKPLDEAPRPDAALDILNIFAPAPSKAASVARVLNAGGGKYEGRNIGAVRVAKIINMVAGINTYAYDSVSSEREINRRFFELEDMIDKANRGKDIDDPDRVPTLEELEELGLIPPRGKAKVVSGQGGSTGPIGLNPRP